MQQLPTETLFDTLLPLSEVEILTFCRTRREYQSICDDNSFWRRKYAHDYEEPARPSGPHAVVNEFPDVWRPGVDVTPNDLSKQPEEENEDEEPRPAVDWHQAYHYKTLTEKYKTIYLFQPIDAALLRERFESGYYEGSQIEEWAPSPRKAIGRWDASWFRNEVLYNITDEEFMVFERETGEPTESESLDVTTPRFQKFLDDIVRKREAKLESSGRRLGDLIPIEWGHTDTTKVVGFTKQIEIRNRNIREFRPDLTTRIGPLTIVTPRIITLTLDTHDHNFQGVDTQRGTPGRFRGMNSTYWVTDAGYTVTQLAERILEFLLRYSFFAGLINPVYAQLNNYEGNRIDYFDEFYLPNIQSMGN